MAPIAAELVHLNLPFQLIHTGQHYSRNMSEIFLRELGMPPLNHFLDIGKGTFSQQLAKCLTGLEKLFLRNPPSAILVEGDTNTVLAGALSGSLPTIHPRCLNPPAWNMEVSKPHKESTILLQPQCQARKHHTPR